MAGADWAEKTLDKMIENKDLPDLGSGLGPEPSDRYRAARAVLSIADGKLFVRAGRGGSRAPLERSLRKDEKAFWRGVMGYAHEVIREEEEALLEIDPATCDHLYKNGKRCSKCGEESAFWKKIRERKGGA